MKLGTTVHPKFKRLQKLLKRPQYAVAGILELVWSLAAQFADDGEISRFTNQEIADYCEWDADPDELIEALIACRWLDRDGDAVRIHDWEEHCPSYISDRIRKRKPFQEVPSNSGDFRNFPATSKTFQEVPENSSPSHSHSQARPSPSQSQPNQTSASAASLPDADAESLIEGMIAGLDMEEVRQQASKLRKADKASVMTVQFVWESAVISECVKPGFCSEVATGMRTSGIRKPKAYIDKALRDECEQRGFPLTKIRAKVPACPVQSGE